MKLRNDIKNEKRNNLLMILFAVAFLVIAFKVTGQTLDVSRHPGYDYNVKKQTTSISPTNPLIFGAPVNENDTIFLSIKADSLGSNIYSICLFVNYPKEVKLEFPYPTLRIDFDNGYTSFFNPIRVFNKINKIEYQVTPESLINLTENKYNHVVFGDIAQSYIKSDESFFIDFLQVIK